ncbi:unnamed protein product [Rhizoctonia solani]|uniref:Uncharacterized protein n=1 Tax=Rhizoctonia solani TaxID=456999 RepID=A0A8H3C8L8_9AGAM|nr:unnamed protein product [Rhizoctonia solani]CAE6474113.1 unnamed protein product [Rhizoctonia solani]
MALSTVKYLVADPDHGKYGTLICQTINTPYSNPDKYYLYEIVEIFLKDIFYRPIENDSEVTNDTNEDMQVETKVDFAVKTPDGGEWGSRDQLATKVQTCDFTLGGELKALWDHAEMKVSPDSVKSTVKPGETLYRYRAVHRLEVRTWWIVDMYNTRSVFTTPEGTTLAGNTEIVVVKGALATTTRLTHISGLYIEPIAKRWDDSLEAKQPRKSHGDVPEDLKQQVNFHHKKAIGKLGK